MHIGRLTVIPAKTGISRSEMATFTRTGTRGFDPATDSG